MSHHVRAWFRAVPLPTAVPLSNVALLVTATAFAAFAAPAVAGVPGAGPAPASMAALGDSITRGFDACGFYVECTSRSWAAGDDTHVESHYLRIKARNHAITGHNNNDARSGASAADLVNQARTAVAQRVRYVAILIGANDACRRTESLMTPTATFGRQVDAALDVLEAGLPGVRIFVASIPDLWRLWNVEKGSRAARTVWALGGICQALLADPTSTAPAATARRARVRQRVVDYNTRLAGSCAAHPNCRFDGNAVFNAPFGTQDVSGWDHFHPNESGQAMLARLTYATGFGW